MTVHLVGAGPGDPELITVRGLELVRSCDVLVADALVAQELVDEAPDDALVISRAGLKQETVTSLIVAYGTAGLDVVRLKGGDPFVFGRGGEEALALAEAGIPFEVVPGVSAMPAVTPGPTSNATPCSRHSCASSPPRPKTNGSPPLRRTTDLPSRAIATIRRSVSSCSIATDPGALPT